MVPLLRALSQTIQSIEPGSDGEVNLILMAVSNSLSTLFELHDCILLHISQQHTITNIGRTAAEAVICVVGMRYDSERRLSLSG